MNSRLGLKKRIEPLFFRPRVILNRQRFDVSKHFNQAIIIFNYKISLGEAI